MKELLTKRKHESKSKLYRFGGLLLVAALLVTVTVLFIKNGKVSHSDSIAKKDHNRPTTSSETAAASGPASSPQVPPPALVNPN